MTDHPPNPGNLGAGCGCVCSECINGPLRMHPVCAYGCALKRRDTVTTNPEKCACGNGDVGTFHSCGVVGGTDSGTWRQTPSPTHDPLRRSQMWRWTPAEHAVRAAGDVIEHAGCDVRLTRALNKLHEAFELVADFVDGVPDKPDPAMGQAKCTRCNDLAAGGAMWADNAEAFRQALRRCVDAWDSDEGMTEACEAARALLERGQRMANPTPVELEKKLGEATQKMLDAANVTMMERPSKTSGDRGAPVAANRDHGSNAPAPTPSARGPEEAGVNLLRVEASTSAREGETPKPPATSAAGRLASTMSAPFGDPATSEGKVEMSADAFRRWMETGYIDAFLDDIRIKARREGFDAAIEIVEMWCNDQHVLRKLTEARTSLSESTGSKP